MTFWKELFVPSRDTNALIVSELAAIDIAYLCPKCESGRTTIWLFPDTTMAFTDECCNQKVIFHPKEGDEDSD